MTAGQLNGFFIRIAKALKDRNVILFPDLGAFEKWSEKAQMLNSLFPSNSQKVHLLSPNTHFKFPSPFGEGVRRTEEVGESTRRGIEVRDGLGVRYSISTLLEDIATPEAKAKGLDVADFMIEQLSKTKAEPVLEIQSHFSPTLQSLLEINPALFILINRLNLEEI